MAEAFYQGWLRIQGLAFRGFWGLGAKGFWGLGFRGLGLRAFGAIRLSRDFIGYLEKPISGSL